MFDLILKGNAVLPDGLHSNCWIGVARGKVVAIGEGDAPDAKEVRTVENGLILPGIVDGQTHACSYGGLPGIKSTTRSAIAGGVTTLVDMPYDNPDPLNTKARLDEKIEAIESVSHADMALYATVAPGQDNSDIEALIGGGVVAFKVSTFESNPTRFPRISSAQILQIFEALAPTDIPLGVHNEDQEIVEFYMQKTKEAGQNGLIAHSQSRPPAAEMAATAQFLELGAAANAHAHIVHLTTRRGFQLVDQYAETGHRSTGELCVHYLWFDPEKDGERLGAKMKVNPPIRPNEIEALWDEILSGRVAFVSSDHSSWPIDNKLTPSIFDAGAGIPGLETLLPSFYTAAEQRGLDAALITAEMLCERPAKFFGLWPQKGAIQLGGDADFAILSLEPHVWDSAKAHDDLNWSPFDGLEFSAKVTSTYLRGELVWDGDQILAKPGVGKYLKRLDTNWFDA